MTIRPKFGNTGVDIHFESESSSAGEPSQTDVYDAVTDSLYTLNSEDSSLCFNLISGET